MYIPSLFCSCYEKPPGAFMYPFHFHFHFHLHLHLTSIHQAISYVANAHLRPAPKHLPPPRPAQRYPSVPPTISTTSQPSINVTNPIHTSTPPSHRSAPRPTSNGLCMYACMHACTYSPSHSPTDMLSLGERTNVVQGWHRPTLMRVCIWVRRFTVHTDTAFVGGER